MLVEYICNPSDFFHQVKMNARDVHIETEKVLFIDLLA